VTQDARDHRGLIDPCDEPEPPAAARARENVEAVAFAQALRRASPKPWRRRETPTHQIGPQVGTPAGRSPLAAIGRIGSGGSGLASIDARLGR